MAGCPLAAKVTIFQLEKIYGKGSEARAFIDELIRGSWAELVGIELVPGLSFWKSQLNGSYITVFPILGQAGVPHPQAGCRTVSEGELGHQIY